RRAVRSIEAAAQPVSRRARPIDELLEGFDRADGAEVRHAAAELDVEVLDTARPAPHDRNQELAVDLPDVELAGAVLRREQADYGLDERFVDREAVRLVRKRVLSIRRTERVLERTRTHLRERAGQVAFDDRLLDLRRVVQLRRHHLDAVVGRHEVAHDGQPGLARRESRLESRALRIALTAEP